MSAANQQSSVIEEVEAFLDANEPRILAIEEQAHLQELLWQLRDNACNARQISGIAVRIGAVLNLCEEAFELAREARKEGGATWNG